MKPLALLLLLSACTPSDPCEEASDRATDYVRCQIDGDCRADQTEEAHERDLYTLTQCRMGGV